MTGFDRAQASLEEAEVVQLVSGVGRTCSCWMIHGCLRSHGRCWLSGSFPHLQVVTVQRCGPNPLATVATVSARTRMLAERPLCDLLWSLHEGTFTTTCILRP